MNKVVTCDREEFLDIVRRALRSHAKTKSRTGREHAPYVWEWEQLYKNVLAGEGVTLVITKKDGSK